MKSKTSQFVILILAIIIFVFGIGFISNKAQAPGKYDDFAKALTDSGAKFYGAFWCPHCQTQKEEFGSSKKYLPYVECSNPDRSTTDICEENKIESFPTWTFKDGITLASEEEPLVCDVMTEPKEGDDICNNIGSAYFKTWLFKEYKFSVKSPSDPVNDNGVWKFSPDARATGEIPLPFLAEQIGFTLSE